MPRTHRLPVRKPTRTRRRTAATRQGKVGCVPQIHRTQIQEPIRPHRRCDSFAGLSQNMHRVLAFMPHPPTRKCFRRVDRYRQQRRQLTALFHLPTRLAWRLPRARTRLNELETAEELKANRERKPMQRRFFPEGKDDKQRSCQDFSWRLAEDAKFALGLLENWYIRI